MSDIRFMKMRITRIFNAVGQGAFYTETFLGDDGSHFVVVYDCGTETAKKDLTKSLDDQIDLFAASYSVIDILFISHFHADHISGLKRLLSKCKVKKTVIPMLDWPTITVTRVQNYLRFDRGLAVESDEIIQSLYFGDGKDERFGEINVVTPGTEDPNNIDKDRAVYYPYYGERVKNGQIIKFDDIWEYIPFNSIELNDQRAIDLFNLIWKFTNGRMNVEDIVNRYLDELKKMYKQAMNNANDNLYTLVVTSKPVDGVIPQPRPRLAHCVYFGDFDYNQKNNPWERLNQIINYDAIGTVQVPHHGARGNWKTEMGNGDRRHYVVSSGSTNRHHHPNFWVLREIKEKGHRLLVISEKWNTRRKYVFHV